MAQEPPPLAVAGTHPKEHRDRFVDWKIRDPWVGQAPGRERGDRQEALRHPFPQIADQSAIKATLRKSGVEVELEPPVLPWSRHAQDGRRHFLALPLREGRRLRPGGA